MALKKTTITTQASPNTKSSASTGKDLTAKATAEVVQLPLWPESARGTPNALLRGALFAAIQGKNRRYLKRELLAVQRGIEIRYTGEQLDQSDMDVWELAVHLCREQPLGNVCNFTYYGFLKALGRSIGKANRDWLDRTLTRLVACEVRITHERRTYFGNLIQKGYKDEATGHFCIQLNSDLIKLYESGYTQINWQQRQQLRGKPLALWLYGYFSSHRDPFPVKVSTLMKLSGSNTKNKKHFKANLKTALSDLQTLGTLARFTLDEEIVTVVKGENHSDPNSHLMAEK
jgi:hypothetical protein